MWNTHYILKELQRLSVKVNVKMCVCVEGIYLFLVTMCLHVDRNTLHL